MMARGTLLLMAGQLAFMASGYAINIFLARRLGPEDLGLFGIILAILVWVELFVINGVPTAMQHFLPEGKYDARSVVRQGVRLQGLYCLIVWSLFLAAAPIFARFFHDDRLTVFFWIASIDIVIYGLYWLFVGVLSGKRKFAWQAVTTTAYALGKLAAVVALVLLGMGVTGALIGNWLGSLVGMLIGMRFGKTPFEDTAEKPAIERSALLAYARPIIVYTIIMNLLLYLDIAFVKKYLTDADVGFYHVAGTLARIPYFIFIGLSFTLLPTLSRTIARNEHERARQQIRQVMRFLFLLLVPTVIFIGQNAEPLIRLLYSEVYLPAAQILPVLTLALVMYTLFYITTTVLNADKKPALALWIAAGAGVVDLAANILWVPRYGTVGAAMATGLASAVGMFGGFVYIFRRFRSGLSLFSLLRMVTAGLLAALVTVPWEVEAAGVLLKAIGFVLAYFVLLIMGRELNGSDWLVIKHIFAGASARREAPTA